MIYRFENFVLDVGRRELLNGTTLVAVEPQVFDLISYLVQNRERVVSKDDLIEHVWNGRVVSESTLTSRITSARQALGDDGENQRLIRTVSRKGLRFVAEVREGEGPAQAAKPEAVGPSFDPVPPVSHGTLLPRLPDKPSIAVLPFTNMSGDPEQEYFSDGITEDIITALSRLHWFFVIARNSTFVYKGQAVNVKQVGRDLGVRYVLEGSVRKSGPRVRITCQLLDGISGNHIWSERYDRELTDIFALQDEITASVTSAIEPKLLAAEGMRSEARSTEDLDAWDLVARALSHFWKLTAADSANAIAILRQAVEHYPNYAPAHSMLAFALFASGYVGWIPPGTERDFAAQLARRAAELDDSDPWAHLALGYYEFTGRNTDEAIRHFSAALDLNPNFAAAAGSIGFALALDGRSDEAIRHFEQALRMSPRDPFNSFFYVGIAAAHYLAGRYAEAIKWAKQAVQLRPGYIGAHRILCASLAQAGQAEEARTVLQTLRQMHPEISLAWIRQSVPYTAGPMENFLDGMRKAGLS
ncbi:MAG TPA: winged helix-turn-helix domain-containing tetratricopeptide repeat protein [Xanthobacteraceae bacterium]|nr:winged helix-turn-helix domain-containing tetratricopeptide repeat protein [Xanthobacteraceae bacterium]